MVRLSAAPLMALLVFLVIIGSSLPVAAQPERQQPVRDYWPTTAWRVSPPEAHGINADMLQWADQRLHAEWPMISSLVVVHSGEVVFERSYNGYGPTDAIHIWSTTKSITSAAVGIAIGDGALDLESTIGEVMPHRIPVGADPRVAHVSVRDLLTMTGGWDWRSNTDFANLDNHPDWIARTLELPMVTEPGTYFTCNSGISHVLGVMVQEATDEPFRDFVQERVFDPIGIEPHAWIESPQGEVAGGWGLYLTPREMARFGYLFLNNGEWDGEQIVPAEWVQDSTLSHVVPGQGHNLGNSLGYGYQWWIDEAAGYASYFALGYGEQVIYVVPDLDLVVVAVVGDDIPVELLQYPRAIIEEVIVPSVAT